MNATTLQESAYLPQYRGENGFDEVSGFRKAIGCGDGYYFACRVQPDFETPATPQNKWPSMVPGFDPSDILVFRWDAEPRNGDVVLVEAFTRPNPLSVTERALKWISRRSNFSARLLERFNLPREGHMDREYIVRRYFAEGKPDLDSGTGFRLESLNRLHAGDGLRSCETMDLLVLGVLTEHRPWGMHSELAVC